MVTKATTLTKGRHSTFFVPVVSVAVIVIATWAGRGQADCCDAVPRAHERERHDLITRLTKITMLTT